MEAVRVLFVQPPTAHAISSRMVTAEQYRCGLSPLTASPLDALPTLVPFLEGQV